MGPLTLREGWGLRKPVRGHIWKSLPFLPLLSVPGQSSGSACTVGSCVLGWPAFFCRRSDHEVGLGLWFCRVLGDFILWSSKHLHVPAGRWWSLGRSLKVNLCLYGMFFFKMRKATCLSRWELELSRGVIRKDIPSLRDVFREGRVATAGIGSVVIGVSSVVMCKVFLPE